MLDPPAESGGAAFTPSYGGRMRAQRHTRAPGRAAGSDDAIARARRASPPLAAAIDPAFTTMSLPSEELLPVRIEHVLGSQSGHNLPASLRV